MKQTETNIYCVNPPADLDNIIAYNTITTLRNYTQQLILSSDQYSTHICLKQGDNIYYNNLDVLNSPFLRLVYENFNIELVSGTHIFNNGSNTGLSVKLKEAGDIWGLNIGTRTLTDENISYINKESAELAQQYKLKIPNEVVKNYRVGDNYYTTINVALPVPLYMHLVHSVDNNTKYFMTFDKTIVYPYGNTYNDGSMCVGSQAKGSSTLMNLIVRLLTDAVNNDLTHVSLPRDSGPYEFVQSLMAQRDKTGVDNPRFLLCLLNIKDILPYCKRSPLLSSVYGTV